MKDMDYNSREVQEEKMSVKWLVQIHIRHITSWFVWCLCLNCTGTDAN